MGLVPHIGPSVAVLPPCSKTAPEMLHVPSCSQAICRIMAYICQALQDAHTKCDVFWHWELNMFLLSHIAGICLSEGSLYLCLKTDEDNLTGSKKAC